MSNPFVSGVTPSIQDELESLPLFQEYDWDFDNDTFVYDENNKHVIVYKNEALKVWIYHALKTERNMYRAFDQVFGCDMWQYIGNHANDAESASVIKQYIIECLQINPYIKSIDDINAIMEDDVVTFEIYLTTSYGKMYTEVSL